MRLRDVAAALAIAGLATAAARAQRQPAEKHEGMLLSGLSLPATKASLSPYSNGESIGTRSFMVEARYLYNVVPQVGLGVDFGFVTGEKRFTLQDQILMGTQVTSMMTSRFALALAEYRPLPQARFSPFLSAGLGIHRSEVAFTLEPRPGFGWASPLNDRLLHGQGSAVAAAFRGGLDWVVGAGSIGLEAGYLYLAPILLHNEGAGTTLGIQQAKPSLSRFVMNLRVAHRFGGTL